MQSIFSFLLYFVTYSQRCPRRLRPNTQIVDRRRSGEGRGGEEGGTRWGAGHLKKKKKKHRSRAKITPDHGQGVVDRIETTLAFAQTPLLPYRLLSRPELPDLDSLITRRAADFTQQ